MVKICTKSLLHIVALLVLRWEVVSAICRGYCGYPINSIYPMMK
jgi:hypothetical protein